ncbi:hypothetical protein K469DRAFT_555567 [Zopfia rhizophila CBS 207.26]|uniref:DUF6594 domain-containing protein n=1 Tax=Zopfia rhizophila CBS 207.26 TaxID=1314779 RepID=A0A6A6ELA8_9PEZI|nr:hypothetical protein K469DRAFT_555567 [Zopfia rhizophila CBS 207.26]
MPSTRPTSFEEPTIKPGTRPNSFEEPNITLGTHPIFPQRPPPTSLPNPVQEDEDVELGRWLVHTFRDILFNIRRDQEAGKNTRPHLTVDLARLNQMRRLKLQAKLIQQVLHMRYHMTEPKGWEDSLEQYINASKEDDFIQTFTQTCVNKGLNDPFVITTENKGHRALLTTLLDTIPEEERKADGLETITNETFAPPVEPVIGNSPHSTGETRLETIQKQNKEAFIKRLVFSLVGGVFLIAPMWLMVLHNTTYTALISTSVFVTTWAVVAAWQLGDPINVLSTTAAYAAVLVVFVGTNTAT